ncbi:hypothetical protein NQ317_017126 [Molorchus minor]|uniref:Uncharacterized protein n=1 Tax=Molorchus minor TaxID=1323400 RepID=A0ABQ9JH19_9CUCU|nr:hypothetical protein NQ317_017126 [Molorchus minor]
MTFNKIKMHLCYQKLTSNDNKNKYIKGRNDISRYEPLNLYLNTTYLQVLGGRNNVIKSGLSVRRAQSKLLVSSRACPTRGRS